MTKVINVSNFKGGVGKTTNSVLLALTFSEQGKKVLFIDFDPQAHATDLLYYKTFKNESISTTIFDAFRKQDLSSAIYKLNNNIDIIPSDTTLRNFPRLLTEMFNKDYKKYAYLLDALLYPIKNNYDYIFIDVPPTTGDFIDNVIVASDYMAIVMQPHESSLLSLEDFYPYINEFIDKYNTDIDLLAVIPVMYSKRSINDRKILKQAEKIVGDKITKTKIPYRERLKNWWSTGIKNEDRHDKLTLTIYYDLTKELLERLK